MHSRYITPVMYIDPDGDSFIVIIIAYAAAITILTASTLIYGAVEDEIVLLDLSFYIPIGAGTNLKLGITAVFNFEDDYVEFYTHEGVSLGYSIGPSYSSGIVSGYENEGDYQGPFVFMGEGYFLGIDHCYDPSEPHESTVRSTQITIGYGPSIYIGYDEYQYLEEWTIRW